MSLCDLKMYKAQGWHLSMQIVITAEFVLENIKTHVDGWISLGTSVDT